MKERSHSASIAWRTRIDGELLRLRNTASAVKGPLSDDEWTALLGDGTVVDLDQRRKTATTVAEKVALWRRAHRINERIPTSLLSSQERKHASRHRAWHQDAVSDVLAWHAEQKSDYRFGVKQFRNDVLAGRLLEIEQIAKWVEDHAKRDGRPVAAATVSDGPTTRSVETLAYARPGSEWMHRVAVKAGGTLHQLRAVTNRLKEFYGWDEAQAAAFVLTGRTPLVHSIRATVTTSSPLLVRSRIKLSIDPSTTSREVADYYRRVRKEAFGRIRRLGEKNARLAAFTARLPDDLALTEQMHRWNCQCLAWRKPGWRFRHPSRFITEAQRSVDRLVELRKA